MTAAAMMPQLSILNAKPRLLDGPALLHELIALASPSNTVALDHTFADGRQETWSYQQLHARANSLASQLVSAQKIAPQTQDGRFIVPMFIEQSPLLYITQLAILKAGGAFCPIPLDVPEERLRFMLKDIEASLLLTTSLLQDQLPEVDGVNVIAVDKAVPQSDYRGPSLDIHPSQPAYVMYTSGSTGQPKGVILSHSAATQAMLAHDQHIPSFSRFLQFANPTFDVSVFEIFFPLIRGATLVSCDRRQLLNDLPGTIIRLKVDGAELTPSVASTLLGPRQSVPGLKLLLTIGEMLKKSVIEEFGGNASEPGILYGMYGPTEATIHCTLQAAFTKDMPPGTIGVPLETVSAFIVEPNSIDSTHEGVRVVAVGEEGELAVGGYQLADGYLNRDEQTKAAFIDDPTYGRLYRTGDRARLLADGTLECLGRISNGQVKLRGQRIELGEIEYAAAQTPGCRSVVADVMGGTLVVFCVCHDQSTTVDDIRTRCKQWLPAYMVPSDILIVETLPYLSSGKVDRLALQVEYSQVSEQSSHSGATLTRNEQQFADAVSRVLRVTVDGSTKFGTLGLDSLSAIRVAAELRRARLAHLDAITILEATDVSHLRSLAVLQAQRAEEAVHDLQIREAADAELSTLDDTSEYENAFACTAVQSAMLAETARDPKAYCNWIVLETRELAFDRISAALARLAATHALLRSGFVALRRSEATHAVVERKELLRTQIRQVTDFQYNFELDSANDLLFPCRIQIRTQDEHTHVLIQLHHALYDQWSIDVIKVDLAVCLRGGDLDDTSSFNAVSSYYAAQSKDALLDTSSDYWQDHLRGFNASPIPNLSSHTNTSALVRTPWLSTTLKTNELRECSRKQGFNAPSVFQAALACLLSSYIGTSDVLFGTVFSGRHIPVGDIERVFGPCLTTLPCRIDLSSIRTSLDLLRLVANQNRDLQRHSVKPLAEIKKLGGCAPGSALFDTLFVWQETSLELASDDTIREIDSADYHEFNLVLEYEPANADVRVRATFQQSLLPLEQVKILLNQINCMARFLVENLEAEVLNASPSYGAILLSIANPEPPMSATTSGLVLRIAEQSRDRPSAVAISFTSSSEDEDLATEELSYAQLDEESNKLASYLMSSKVWPNDLVCIWMDKSLKFYVAVLAVLKAGAAYLPLVPETPCARVESVVAQAGVNICLCDSATIRNAPQLDTIRFVSTHQLDLSHHSNSPLKVPYNGSHLAYAVFTSGSTGTPKGVAVTNENISSNLVVLAELYQVKPGDRLLQACSHAFDVSVFEILFAFSTGMTLCSATKATLFRDLEHSIRTMRITHLSLTPTVAALVDPVNVPSVRFLITAGEAVTNAVHRKWAGKGLHTGYGPSETTNICNVHMHTSPDGLVNNVGPPLRNTSAFVISPGQRFHILPAGATGELAFGGEQVFRGYLGMDDLNASKIINHPEYGRIYKSGDIGRLLCDGTMTVMGRLDDQVKIRGNRIELGEINAMLLQSPAVRQCVTIVRGIGASDQTLVAFWLPESAAPGLESNVELFGCQQEQIIELFSCLEASLPTYMIPSFLVPVTALPLTVQGKLDKQRLLAFMESMDADTQHALSRSAVPLEDADQWNDEEKMIAKVLSQTLCIPESGIGRNTSFFALGLNSLSAIAFAKRLEAELKKRMTMNTILRNQSVARLTRSMMTSSKSGQATPETTIDGVIPADVLGQVKRHGRAHGLSITAIMPCTPLQEAMLVASAAGTSSAYCNETSFEISGNIDTLKECWEKAVARQAILRTRFVETEMPAHPYLQVVMDQKPLPWRVLDAEQKRSPTLRSHRITDKSNSVNGDEPYLITVQLSKSSSVLTLSMHHAVYDGISIANLLAEVEQLYRGQTLPEAVSFEPFLAHSISQNGPEAVQHWSKQLHDFTPKPFPLVRDGLRTVEKVSKETCAVSTAELEAFCKRHSVSSLSLFQAAWVKVLSSAQQDPDVCFGNVVSGRTISSIDIDRLVAPCFNTIPIRTRLDKSSNNGALIRQMHNQNIDNVQYQLTGLRRLQPLSKRPDLHLFDSLLLLQPPQRALDPSIWTLTKEEGTMDMSLVIEIIPQDSNIDILLHYASSAISEDLAGALLTGFVAALVSCLEFFSGDVNHFVDFEDGHISGKLISSAYPEHESSPEDADQGTWSAEEIAVRDILAKLASVDVSSIGKSTSIYRLGLDSLNAVKVASQLRAKGLQLDAADIIENLTPIAIAAAAAKKADRDTRATDNALPDFDREHRSECIRKSEVPHETIDGVYPCTPVQNGMLVQSLNSCGRLYVNHITYDVPDGVSAAEIRQAWAAVQDRHPVLRMGFCHIEGHQGPFAMMIYRSAALPVVSAEGIHIGDDTAAEVTARNIVDHLHQPAWRVSVTPGEINSRMKISIHHALYDAESLQILLKDFKITLSKRDLGPVLPFEPLLAASLSAGTQDLDKARRFWERAMQSAGFAKMPSLTSTVVKNGMMESLCRICSLKASELERSCKQKDCTIQAVGQSAWALLLAAYTGEVRNTFGTVFSGRSTPEAHEIAFPSITTIPVSCDTGKSQSDLIADMVAYNASAQRYRYLPLSEIQRLAHRPTEALFDTVFVYQKFDLAPDDVFSWHLVSETAAVDYSASLELEILANDEISARLTFDTNKIPHEQGQLMLRQYEAILGGLADQYSGEDTSHLYSILPAREPTIASPVQLLHEFVESGAREHPDRCALRFVHDLDGSSRSSRSWTYLRLNERGNQIAHLIRRHKVNPGNIIAVCMDKCAEASFAFLGILKSGCAFLAMDPDLPVARQKFILEDSGASLLFIDAEHATTEPLTDIPTIQLSEAELAKLPHTPLDLQTQSPESTSYCLYTSGTTGTPKGCELTHENAVQAMLAFQRLFADRWSASSRWLQFASYWFDVSVLEQFWSWSVGITVIGASRDLVLEDLPAFIQQQKITHIDLTPSLARLLRPEDVPSLHGGVFITGGEALRQEIIEAWGSKQTVCNGYGPTEATIGVTMNTFVGSDAKPSNIGGQFDNVGSFVLTPGSDQPVLKGAIGELCVSGKLVGKGYLNRPELTAKSFPFLERLGTRVYRTGDLVRLLHDGSFVFEGRKDSQAKLRGQRLETAEIDSVIKASSDSIVDTLATVIKADDGGREMLVSFLATHRNKKDREFAVDFSGHAARLVGIARQACERNLPAYMVPTHIIPVTMLALTVNNKVDGKRHTALFTSLATKDLQSLAQEEADSGLLNEIERNIARALAGMVGITPDQLDRSSNVFSAGLSSVSAITFAGALKRKGFTNASVAMVMKNPTIRHLANALSSDEAVDQVHASSVKQAKLSINAFAQRHRAAMSQKLGTTCHKLEAVVPCTPLQEGLILDSIRNAARPYFNEFRYMLGNIDIQRLEAALQTLVDCVQLLRSRFVQTGDGHAQVIMQTYETRLVQPSSSDSSAESFVSSKKAAWLEDNQEDLSRPVQFLLVRKDDDHMLVIHVHHALYDGLSWQLLIKTFAQIYHTGEAPSTGPSFLEALPCGPLREQPCAREFWSQCLRSTPLPRMVKRNTTARGKDLTVTVDVGKSDRLEAVRKSLGVAHQSVLQSCFEVAIQQHFADTTEYGVIVSGRSIALENADQVIGPLFNTVPQSISVLPADTWTELIRRTHDSNIARLPYQHTPLRSIRKWCKRLPTDSMFDTLFVFQQESSGSSATDHWKLVDQPSRADYPLAFEITLVDDCRLTITVVAQGDVAEEDTLRALIQDFQNAIETSAQDTEHFVSEKFQIHDAHIKQDTSAPRGTRHLNGVHDFSWDDEAKRLRHTIAGLAGLDDHSVDEHSTIFSIGLDSIDAVKLSSRLRNDGMPISVSQLLKAQTIPRILHASRACRQDTHAESPRRKLSDIGKRLREYLPATLQSDMNIVRVLPATPSQEALIADMLRSELHDYFNHDVLRLQEGTDLAKLYTALQAVVDSSPILRTSFVEVTSPETNVVYAQLVHRSAPIRILRISVTSIDEIDDVLDEVRRDVQASGFERPPVRFTFVTNQAERYLVLSIAHAQYDGHSLTLMHADIRSAYHGVMNTRPTADSLIEASIDATSEEARSFWINTIAGATTSPFPGARHQRVSEETSRAEKTCTISAADAQDFCRQRGCSQQALAQLAWSIVLAHYTRKLDVMFGAVLACRDSEEAEQTMFPAMNTVPIRAVLHGSRGDVLRHMQDAINDMRPYQRTPLRTVQALCKDLVQRNGLHTADNLFDTIFIYQHRPDESSDHKTPLYDSVQGRSSVEYPVAAEMESVDHQILIRAASRGSVLDATGTAQLLDTLDLALTAIVQSPSKQTVEFNNDKVSICGLPGVRLREEAASTNDISAAADLTTTESDVNLSPTALKIREAFAKVSKVPADSISPTASIESIGIDSISAIKVAALLRKECVTISVSQIIRAKTVNRITELLSTDGHHEKQARTNSSRDVIAALLSSQVITKAIAGFGVPTSSVESVLPATAGQVYMLSMWHKTNGQLFYPTFSYELKTTLPIETLREAWTAFVTTQPMLRTVFYATQHTQVPFLQVVMKGLTRSSFQEATVTTSYEDQPMATLRAIEREYGYLLELRIHHALYDAVTESLIMQDFVSLLTKTVPLSSQAKFEDFLALSATPKAIRDRKTFWTSYMAETRLLHLRQPKSNGAQQRVEMFTPSLFTEYNALATIAREQDVTVQALLFAVYAKVYAGLADKINTEAEDVVLGIYLSNRSHLHDLDILRAPTLNLVPLLIRSPATRKVLDLAHSITADLQQIGSAENSAVGLWEIAEWTGVKVDAFVNFIKLPERDEERPQSKAESAITAIQDNKQPYSRQSADWTVTTTAVDGLKGMQVSDAYQFSLDLEATVAGGELDMGLFCSAEMLQLDAAKDIFEQVKQMLEEIIA